MDYFWSPNKGLHIWSKKGRRRRRRGRRRRGRRRSSQGMETEFKYGTTKFDYESLVLYGYYLASNLGFVRISS